MGFQHTHTVDQWPSWDAVAQYEQAIGWSGTGAPPEPEVLQQQPHMVDVLGEYLLLYKLGGHLLNPLPAL